MIHEVSHGKIGIDGVAEVLQENIISSGHRLPIEMPYLSLYRDFPANYANIS
jgi:hypothetical protein